MQKLMLMLLLAPGLVMAQSNAGMPKDMTQMLLQAQKAQACMQEIDQSQMDKFKKEGDQMEARIKGLCDSGKRDEAQEQAIAFSRKMMDSSTMIEIKQCTEMMRGMLPEMPFDNIEEKMASTNICDEMK